MGSIETYGDILGTECVGITTSQDVYIPSPSLLVSPVSYTHKQSRLRVCTRCSMVEVNRVIVNGDDVSDGVCSRQGKSTMTMER